MAAKRKTEDIESTNGNGHPAGNWSDMAEFVRVWQTAESAQAVADHFGKTVGSVSNRVSFLKKKNVQGLRSFRRAQRHDYEALSALAQELAQPE